MSNATQAAMPVGNSPINILGTRYFKQKGFEEGLLEALRLSGLSRLDECEARNVTLDWSPCEWLDLSVVMWSIVLLHQLKEQKCQLFLKLPDRDTTRGERLWSFLKRWKFFETVRDCVAHPADLLSDDQFKLYRRQSKYHEARGFDIDGNEVQLEKGNLLGITNFLHRRTSLSATSAGPYGGLDEYINRWKSDVIALGLKNLCGWSLSTAKDFMGRVIREGLFNSVRHADGTLLLAGFNVDQKNLIVGIADDGAGIPEVLRGAFGSNPQLRRHAAMSDVQLIRYYTDSQIIKDSQLISLSTRKGVTSDPGAQGLGLYYLKTTVLDLGGELRIRSGEAFVDFGPDGKEDSSEDLLRSPGTMIRVLMPRDVTR